MLFENRARWSVHYGMSSIRYQQWYADRMHMYVVKDSYHEMIPSTSFAVIGLSHLLDHSCYCPSIRLNIALWKLYYTMLNFRLIFA